MFLQLDLKNFPKFFSFNINLEIFNIDVTGAFILDSL